MNQLQYSPRALRDLRGIAEYIGRDNPARAASFVAELRTKAAQAAERPQSFRGRDEIARGLRSLAHKRYVLFFRQLGTSVRIERVMHSARKVSASDLT